MAEAKPKGSPVFLEIPATGETITLPGVTSLSSDDELKAAADAWIAKNYKGPLLATPVVARTPVEGETQGILPGEEIKVTANRQPELKAYVPDTFAGSILDAIASGVTNVAGFLPGFDERGAVQYGQDVRSNIETLLGLEGTERSFRDIAAGRGTGEDYLIAGLTAAPFAAVGLKAGAKRIAPELSATVSRLATGPVAVADEVAAAVPEAALSPEMAAVATPITPAPVVPSTLPRARAVELPEAPATGTGTGAVSKGKFTLDDLLEAPATGTRAASKGKFTFDDLLEAPVAAAAIPEAAPLTGTGAVSKGKFTFDDLLETPEAAVIPEAAVVPKLEVPPAPKVTEGQGRAALFNLEKKDLTNPTTKLPVTKKVADFAADYLTATNLQWDRQSPFIDFFRQHFHADTLPPETVQDLYKKYDIQEEDWMEIMTGVRQTVGDAGRTLAYLRGAANKIPEGAADLAQKFNKEVPPPSLWTRSGNAIRGTYIVEAAKVTRDILSSVVQAPLDVVTNIADNALNQVLLNPVRSVIGRPTRKINYGDAFVLFSQNIGSGRREQTRQLLSQLERNAPKVSRDFLDTYSADNVRPALSDKFSKVEKAIDATNFLGRWADGMTRKAVFPAFLRRATDRAGFNFDEMVANQTIHTVPQEVMEKALNDTAQYVFSRKAGEGGPMFLGETAKEVIDLVNNKAGPVGAVTIGYPGFIANALNFQYRYGPGVLGVFTKAGAKKVLSGDTSALSEGMMGLAMVYAAMQFQDSEYAGSKWYTAKMPDGTEKDLRPVFPLPYYLLLGDLINRFQDGTIDQAYTSAEILQGLSGAQFRAGAGLYVVDELIRDLTRAGKLGDKAMDAIKKTLGSAIGGLIPYGGTVKDIVAQANPEEAVLRDTSEAPFLGQALREVPFAQTRFLGLPEQEYASREAPAQTINPLLRQVTGLATSRPANVIEKEMRSLGLDERDLYQKEGFAALDRRQRQLMGYIAEYNAPAYFNSPEYRNADKLTQTEMFREFYKGIRGAARDAVKNENENFAALIWYNDQSREDKTRLDRDFMKAVGKSYREYYGQLVEAPIPANKQEFDALPDGAKYTDPGDYKVYTKGK